MNYDKQNPSHSLPIFMAGGSQVLITADGIVYATKGNFSAKAVTHKLEGPKSNHVIFPPLSPPEPICEECLRAAAASATSYMLR